MEVLKFADYGQERERIATESELEIFDLIRSMAGHDMGLVRKSDNYVTAVYKGWDLARIKFTNRAKWILFPVIESPSNKHRISDPSDVSEFADLVAESMAHIEKYSQ